LDAHLVEEVGGGEGPAVIAEEGFALAIERYEHVLAIPANSEAGAPPQLPLEDVKKRPEGVIAIAALGLGDGWEKARSSRWSLRSCST
jgi:hypothetical protein